MKPKVILVLHGMGASSERFAAVEDIELMFPRYESTSRYLIHSCRLPPPPFLKRLQLDAVLLMSTFLDRVAEEGPSSRWIEGYSFLKTEAQTRIAFPQDDYWYSENRDQFYQLWHVDLVFPVCSRETWEDLIPSFLGAGGKAEQGYTTYMTPRMRNLQRFSVPISRRSTDIVYRSKKTPYFPNRLGAMKGKLAQSFIEAAKSLDDLKLDVSCEPSDLIFGDDWYRFLGNARATLGSPSGSSTLVRNRNAADLIRRHVTHDGDISTDDASICEALRPVLEKNFTALSPRNLEAAVLHTVQILLPGDYGAGLEPNVDYLELRTDMNNVKEVVAVLRDEQVCSEISDNCFRKLSSSEELAVERLIARVMEFIDANTACPSHGRVNRRIHMALLYSYNAVGLEVLRWIRRGLGIVQGVIGWLCSRIVRSVRVVAFSPSEGGR